jgi:hypothetical protein
MKTMSGPGVAASERERLGQRLFASMRDKKQPDKPRTQTASNPNPARRIRAPILAQVGTGQGEWK